MTTDEKALWNLKSNGDLDVRNELVVRYEKTALRLVGRRYNRFIIHRGDWESEISHFLINALDSYSLGSGSAFTTYLYLHLTTAV